MITTADIDAALRTAGVDVTAIEPGDAGEPDIVRLSGDDYLVIDRKEAERAGIVFVSLNESNHSGGDPTLADWILPAATLDEIVAYLSNRYPRKKTMSGNQSYDEQQKRNDEFIRDYQNRIESGLPIINYLIEPPFNCNIENGLVNIDAPCMVAGGSNKAAVVRFSLTPVSAKGLRDFLNTLGFSETNAANQTGKH